MACLTDGRSEVALSKIRKEYAYMKAYLARLGLGATSICDM